MNYKPVNPYFKGLSETSVFCLNYLNKIAERNKSGIYAFMKANSIGESFYGQYLDVLGRSSSQINNFISKYGSNLTPEMYKNLLNAANRDYNYIIHRIAGHHPIFDFPFNDLSKAKDFIMHVWISDFPTTQGVPILPEKVLISTGLIKYCNTLTNNWNFINIFGLLTATISIYGANRNIRDAIINGSVINSFPEFAKDIGVGITELAIAFTSSNPFLLVGSIIQLFSTIVKIANDNSDLYFKRILDEYSFENELSGSIDINYMSIISDFEQEIEEFNLEKILSSDEFNIL